MRKESRFALGIVGLSAVATSYLVGHQNVQSSVALSPISNAETAAAQPSTDPSVTTTPADSAQPAATSQPSSAGEPSASSKPAPKNTTKPVASATQDPAPAPAPATSAADGNYQSSNVGYRYGDIQLEITVQSGKLTGINLLRATTEGRGYDQAPPMLVQAALQAGSTDFANLSGATFTSLAFKQALTDALNQAGL
ncbi:MAG: hypothetical protein RL384_987 [Actinomycetota bacterium]